MAVSELTRRWSVVVDDVGNNPDILINEPVYGIVAEIGGGALAVRLANAKLIAAAPEMFEVLVEMIAEAVNGDVRDVTVRKAMSILARIEGD